MGDTCEAETPDDTAPETRPAYFEMPLEYRHETKTEWLKCLQEAVQWIGAQEDREYLTQHAKVTSERIANGCGVRKKAQMADTVVQRL